MSRENQDSLILNVTELSIIVVITSNIELFKRDWAKGASCMRIESE